MKLKKTTFKNKKNAPNITRNNLFDYPTVKGLIKDLEVKKEQGILEKPNFDFLIKLIKKAQSENEIVNICTLGTGYYKTTLKFSPKLEVETSKIHYFCKNKSLSFKQPKGENNKLIIGDNYHALQNLLISYRSKIDVIYIDPPYGCNSMGEGAKTNYGNEHLNRNHLLSSLKPRLTLAKQLLSSSGLIFCSIDDSNQAYIKCLFDDIFGEKNFLCNFV
jgi:adenine-specific DNA-methyltransferase